ncbi:MAG: MGMT family protein [Planctomycetota bacterium]
MSASESEALTRRESHPDVMRSAFVRVIEKLRLGEVVSYGDVARRAGFANRHRAVGKLLASSMDALPWWRVVYSSGHLPPCNPTLQEERLTAEGVTLVKLKVVRAPYGRFSST